MTEQDLPMLHTWLGRPHIVEWGAQTRGARASTKRGPRTFTPDGPALYMVLAVTPNPAADGGEGNERTPR